LCRFPALAKLPESSRPAEAFALTRVVASQDASNVVLVAHEEKSGSQSRKAELAGFIVLTSEVDISSLTDVFDLHPFDNFLEEDVYDAQMDQARESLRVKKVCILCSNVAVSHAFVTTHYVLHAKSWLVLRVCLQR
jgi:hypothetical protein